MRKKDNNEPAYFEHRDTIGIGFKKAPDFNIDAMYEHVYDELVQQQAKRDQLITIYLAAFAFIVPALLSAESISWDFKGAIFIGLGFIGFLFALIIIRYRKYKEVYWVCCRTLNVMMSVDRQEWTKENIQKIFYGCLHKRIKNYIIKDGTRFDTFNFVRKNIFSGETLYLIIHSIISGCVFGLGMGIVMPFADNVKFAIGIISGLAMFFLAAFIYFVTLIKVYSVCVDGLEDSFNKSFNDAWFLHFFI